MMKYTLSLSLPSSLPPSFSPPPLSLSIYIYIYIWCARARVCVCVCNVYVILQGIFEELMLNFHESPEKIIGLLEIILEYDTTQRGKFDTRKQVVSALIIILRLLMQRY